MKALIHMLIFRFLLATLATIGIGISRANAHFVRMPNLPNNSTYSFGCAWGDYDGDGYIDLLAHGASAVEAAGPAAGNLRSRPVPSTPVSAAFHVNDIAQVDDARQQATVDLALRLTWRDPRLEGRFAEPTPLDRDGIWTPRLAFLNDRGLTPRLPDQVLVFPDGEVRYVQRYVGDVAFPTDLAEFPFDRQALDLTVLFLALPGEAEFQVDRAMPLAAPRFSLPGWTTRPPAVEIARGSLFSPDHSRLILTLGMDRQVGYYLWDIAG